MLTVDLDASNVELDGRLDSSDLTVDLDASNVELDGRLTCRTCLGNFDELGSADPYVIVLTFERWAPRLAWGSLARVFAVLVGFTDELAYKAASMKDNSGYRTGLHRDTVFRN